MRSRLSSSSIRPIELDLVVRGCALGPSVFKKRRANERCAATISGVAVFVFVLFFILKFFAIFFLKFIFKDGACKSRAHVERQLFPIFLPSQ